MNSFSPKSVTLYVLVILSKHNMADEVIFIQLSLQVYVNICLSDFAGEVGQL